MKKSVYPKDHQYYYLEVSLENIIDGINSDKFGHSNISGFGSKNDIMKRIDILRADLLELKQRL